MDKEVKEILDRLTFIPNKEALNKGGLDYMHEIGEMIFDYDLAEYTPESEDKKIPYRSISKEDLESIAKEISKSKSGIKEKDLIKFLNKNGFKSFYITKLLIAGEIYLAKYPDIYKAVIIK